MVIGGRTQYETSVQDMSKQVEELLARIVNKFMWKRTFCPVISINIMHLPFEQGGRKVLDVKVRNKAIEIMKTQQYLKLDNNQPKWAMLADKIISEKIMKKPKDEWPPKINVFLQDTVVDMRAGEDCLPTSIY